ncbi:hypothetical protein B0H66DRAFT_274563 [Apodospora peruviana]|uniref:AA1-like domain-containing protein n=1 Tax=Apodospora peruviana TaxID=516989 RepID=A0AAE0HZT4_9PEZI|nr:hypothetical protein B0H66DRAFT_274563 [Apodospora peruviana]
MKLSSVVPFLATVTAAAAAPFINPVIRPMLPVDVFNITDFYAGSIPHSVWSTTKFSISVTTIQPPTLCTAETQSYQHVGDFVQTNCTEPTVSFSLTRTGRADQGAELDIFWSLGDTGLMKGTYFIPGSQFVTSGLGTSVHEDYTGPRDFSVQNVTLVKGGGRENVDIMFNVL